MHFFSFFLILRLNIRPIHRIIPRKLRGLWLVVKLAKLLIRPLINIAIDLIGCWWFNQAGEGHRAIIILTLYALRRIWRQIEVPIIIITSINLIINPIQERTWKFLIINIIDAHDLIFCFAVGCLLFVCQGSSLTLILRLIRLLTRLLILHIILELLLFRLQLILELGHFVLCDCLDVC